MKLGALPLLLLNSIRSEKSSSAMGSGRGLAGLRRGGRYPPPREPDDVEGRDSKSSPASADAEPALNGETRADCWPRKDRDGGGDDTEIPESGELLAEVSPLCAESEAAAAAGEVEVEEEAAVPVATGSDVLPSPFLSSRPTFVDMIFLITSPGGLHSTTSMLGWVLEGRFIISKSNTGKTRVKNIHPQIECGSDKYASWFQ